MRFIILTNVGNGLLIRFNVAHILRYELLDAGATAITLVDRSVAHVRESPTKIDDLLITNGILVHKCES